MAALLRAGFGHGSGAFLNDLLGHKPSPHRRITSTDDLPSLSEIVRNLSLTFWLAFALYACLVVAFFAFRSSRAPPSPSADEVRELKSGEVAPSAAFFKWGRKYGPLVSFKSGFKTVVVLNDLTLLTDLFHKRSSTHTAKPRRVVADEILSTSLRGQSSGPPFARWRKALDDGLNETASRSYRDLIADASARLLREFLDGGDGDHRRALERFVDGVLLGVCYGAAVTEGDARAHGEAKETYHDACKPSQHAPDTFPILARLPTRIYNPAWHQSIDTARERTTKLYLAALRSARGPSVASIAQGGGDGGKGGRREEEVAYAVASPFVEGREPLLWSLQWCIAALLIFPTTQTALQTSIDAQIPRTRLPTSSDVASLPRLRSFVKECARYWPVVPLLRREVEKRESVNVKGEKGGVSEVYVVEKGAEIIANVDAIAKSDALFPSARDFDPERFMSPTAHDTDFIFGSGMRVCPGRHVAEEAVSLALARILWAFEITQAKDGEVPPGNAFSYRSDGGARGPAPFRFTLRVRGEGVERVVRGESGS